MQMYIQCTKLHKMQFKHVKRLAETAPLFIVYIAFSTVRTVGVVWTTARTKASWMTGCKPGFTTSHILFQIPMTKNKTAIKSP